MTHADACGSGHSEDCRLFGAGHAVHTIQARLVSRTSWGWRDGTVTAVRGRNVEICYLASAAELTCWHHLYPADRLPIGEPVRVHEEFGVLATPIGWLSVAISDGLGAVPPPADAWTWEAEMRPVIVDVMAGSAWEIR